MSNRTQFGYQQKISAYQGPLPPAEDLSRYNKACPDAAERIIAMAERQATHRQEIEKSVIEAGNRNSLLGIIAATVVAVFIVGCGTWVICEGHDIAGSAIIGIDVCGLCGIFIYGTKLKNKGE